MVMKSGVVTPSKPPRKPYVSLMVIFYKIKCKHTLNPEKTLCFVDGDFLSKILNLSIIMFERITKDEQL